MREILTDITTASGPGKVAVMYFDELTGAAVQQAAVAAFWSAIRPLCNSSMISTVRNSGRLIEATDGSLTGTWSAGVSVANPGTNAGEEMADATQALVQWRTSTIVGGRFLRGRTFIPGLSVGNLTNGNLSAGAQTALLTAGNALAAGVNSMVIWHRPKDLTPGSAGQVIGCSIWNELAVLRRRRG